jgi:exodeoxyribonuclease VII small subunit
LTDPPGAPIALAMAEDAAPSDLSFEAALKRLEEIVRELESGNAPLDQAIELYQEGDRLKRQCEDRLKAAQMKIEQIQFDRDGQPAGTAPFGEG